jgi:capsular polysaccharide biosynthesis protein
MSAVSSSDTSAERQHPLADGDTAREAGQNLVANIARALPESRRSLESIVRSSLPYLLEAGIVAEVVRARPGCLVVSASANWSDGPVQRIPFFSSWIETLPLYTGGGGGTLVPSPQNGDTRVYTLLWVPGNGPIELPAMPNRRPRPDATPRPELPSASHSMPVPAAPGGDDDGSSRPLPARIPKRAHRQPASSHVVRPVRVTRYPWLRRRGWMLVVGLIAGVVGGFAVSSMHHATSYTASATLEVRSGAASTTINDANNAETLAVTYAAALSNDQALLRDVAEQLGVSTADVGSGISATAEAGTSLMSVSYKASTAAQALAGIDAISSAASSDTRNESAIARDSLAVVNTPTSATPSKSVSSYGLILGAIFGLMVGAGVALISERSDRRVDDIEALADASGANVTQWPGGLSSLELVRGLGETGEVHAVTVMPMHAAQAEAAQELAKLIDASGHGIPVTVASASDTAAWQGDIQEAPVVLVVGPGERVRTIRELTERLRLLRAAPAWSVLAYGSPGT